MRIGLALALVLTAVAGALGIASEALAVSLGQRARDPLSGQFPGLVSLLGNAIWRGGMVAMLLAALAATRRPGLRALRTMWTTTHHSSVSSALAIPSLAACYCLAFFWSRLPVLGRLTAASPAAYGHAHPSMTGARLVAALTVRYPLTVVVEETFFHGLLQRELRNGFVIANVLFAAYHLQQWRTIPSLLPYVFAGGILLALTGALWVPAVVHYGFDAGYALMFPRQE